MIEMELIKLVFEDLYWKVYPYLVCKGYPGKPLLYWPDSVNAITDRIKSIYISCIGLNNEQIQCQTIVFVCFVFFSEQGVH